MLTIQPNFTSKPVKQITFKGEGAGAASADGLSDAENRFYQEKIGYYENQVKDFDKTLLNKDTPAVFKKVVKGFKIVSEALLEGWAVAWGAKKCANVIKGPLINSKLSKGTAKVFKSAGKVLGRTAALISEGCSKLKATKFMTENKVGKTISKGLGFIEKAFSFIGEKISKWTAPLKDAKAETVYDKAANVTSKTFGVGAGAAGVYNAATNGKQKTDVESENDDEFEDYEKFPEDGE